MPIHRPGARSLTHRPVTITRLQRSIAVVLGLLTIAWISSLPLAPFLQLPAQPPRTVDAPLLRAPPPSPTWRDTLVIDLAVTAPGVQQQRGRLLWTQGHQRASMAVTLLADGRPSAWCSPSAPTPPGVGPCRPHGWPSSTRMALP